MNKCSKIPLIIYIITNTQILIKKLLMFLKYNYIINNNQIINQFYLLQKRNRSIFIYNFTNV